MIKQIPTNNEELITALCCLDSCKKIISDEIMIICTSGKN